MLELDNYYFATYNFITGIDEAGRGPLAGPLVVAAVTISSNFEISGLDDSKKLSDKKRRELYPLIMEEVIEYKIITVSVEEIEELNILHATMKGMQQVYQGLQMQGMILVDGNRLPANLKERGAEAIVKGDQKVSAIAAASILAKVYRDNIMIELDKSFPEYGFCRNKGYGTREHLLAIEQHGITPCHRQSFGPVAQHTLYFDM
ncbi:MAG: ribonuclease HII [Candidatus Cloacimonetes bacterium]|nr:ribonuclease HII [Candidatus Cloacimonadota bacterium]